MATPWLPGTSEKHHKCGIKGKGCIDVIVFATRGPFRGLLNPFCDFLERKGLVESFVSFQWRHELPGLTSFNDHGWMVAHSGRKGCIDAIVFSAQTTVSGLPDAYSGVFLLFISGSFLLPVCVDYGSPDAEREEEEGGCFVLAVHRVLSAEEKADRRVLSATGLHRRNRIHENDRIAIVL